MSKVSPSAYQGTDDATTAAIALAAPAAEVGEMELSPQGADWLKQVEQLRLAPYDDQTGKQIDAWVVGATIGYGHLILSSEWNLYRDGIGTAQAEQLLLDDVGPFVVGVNDAIVVALRQNEFDAAVMLAYNIGIGNFRSSSVVKLINDPTARTSYPSLESAWKAWDKSQGVVNAGLVNRRNAEWGMYADGNYGTW